MSSLLLLVFILQLAIHLVNTFGAATINSLLWNLFIRFPTQTSKSAAEQKELKAQYFKIKQQMNATSSQDEFANYADRAVTALRWLGTNGLRMFLQFWFSRQAMFWVPKGWMPYAAEWALSFPRAPLGSVSIQAWALACGAFILLVSDACVAAAALARGYGASVREIGREQKEAVTVLGDEAAAQAGKKEL
ncbi:CHD5 domain-containing protein [Diplocarpon rosae]|nr:CHD5 domain-containing protein [Diplocarpon rosae]